MARIYRSGSAEVVTSSACVSNSENKKLGGIGIVAVGGSAIAEIFASGSETAANFIWTIATPAGDYRSTIFDGAISPSNSGWYVKFTGTGSLMLNWVA